MHRRASLHRDQGSAAAARKLQLTLALDRARDDDLAIRIDGVNLKHVLRHIRPRRVTDEISVIDLPMAGRRLPMALAPNARAILLRTNAKIC